MSSTNNELAQRRFSNKNQEGVFYPRVLILYRWRDRRPENRFYRRDRRHRRRRRCHPGTAESSVMLTRGDLALR